MTNSFAQIIYPFVDKLHIVFDIGYNYDGQGFPFEAVAAVASAFVVLFGLLYCFRRVIRVVTRVK